MTQLLQTIYLYSTFATFISNLKLEDEQIPIVDINARSSWSTRNPSQTFPLFVVVPISGTIEKAQSFSTVKSSTRATGWSQ